MALPFLLVFAIPPSLVGGSRTIEVTAVSAIIMHCVTSVAFHVVRMKIVSQGSGSETRYETKL